jgi:anti-anti-sigma factor
MTEPIELRVEPLGDPGEYRLAGELDVSNVEATRARLEASLADHPTLSLDTSGVTFMDSQGLRMLLILAERAHAAGGMVTLVNPGRAVRRLLDLAIPQPVPGLVVSAE